MRSPDVIMEDFDAGAKGTRDVDMRGILWEIIEDILDSIRLADGDVLATVTDYVANNYGDD